MASDSGRYRFVRELAEGGMGRVEIAVREEGRFRRVYAVKRLRDVFLKDPGVREMFVDEARLAGLLHHPNAVSVIDTGEDERGPFLVMDYIEGVPLSLVITTANEQSELIPVQLCAEIVKQAAAGLHAAHELRGHDGEPLNLVHRDVSPQNVILGYDGVARITDFGIAKALGRSYRTSTGILKGKRGYLSPEQLQFDEPDRRSDIFCLGVVLYELLAARRLYGGEDGLKSAKRILREPPPDIHDVRKDVHPVLVELLFEMLAKDPSNRPPDAEAVERRLEAILSELALEEEPIRLSDWVAERFADVRDQQRAEVGRLSTAPPEPPRPEPSMPATTPAKPGAALSASGIGAARASGAARVVMIAGAVGVLAWAGAVAFGRDAEPVTSSARLAKIEKPDTADDGRDGAVQQAEPDPATDPTTASAADPTAVEPALDVTTSMMRNPPRMVDRPARAAGDPDPDPSGDPAMTDDARAKRAKAGLFTWPEREASMQ